MFWILILSVLIFGVLIYLKGWADGQKASEDRNFGEPLGRIGVCVRETTKRVPSASSLDHLSFATDKLSRTRSLARTQHVFG